MEQMSAIVKGSIATLVVGGSLCGALVKRHSEKSKPVAYLPVVCAVKLREASALEIREIPFSWGKSYNVVVGNERLGTVYQKAFSWGKRFDFYAGTKESGLHLGHAQEKPLSFGHKSIVYDEHGNEVGKLDEKLLTLNPGHLIEVYDARGDKVAVSDERAFTFTHETTIYNGDGAAVGTTVKSFWWDNYAVAIPSTLDKRLVLALVAMEDKLNDARSSSSSSSSRSK